MLENIWSIFLRRHLLKCLKRPILGKTCRLRNRTSRTRCNCILTIEQNGVFLADNTNAYQESWRLAIADVLAGNQQDYDYLALLS